MTVYVHFAADPSVGIFPYGFSLEIPDFEEDYREQVREDIKKFYTELDGEFSASWVGFSDEKDDEDGHEELPHGNEHWNENKD
jgi:hypothetical protein